MDKQGKKMDKSIFFGMKDGINKIDPTNKKKKK